MSPPASITDDLRRFILTSVPSVSYLEAMLLFEREPAAARNAAGVAGLLYIGEATARELLDALCAAGVIEACPDRPDHFRFAAAGNRLGEIIRQLAAVYATNLVGITNLIHDRTQRSAQHFADAFKLRKD